MIPDLGRALAVLVAAWSLSACAGGSGPTSGAAPASGPVGFPRIRLDGLPGQLAVGDSVQLRVVRDACFADFCAPVSVSAPLTWTTSPPELAGIAEQGRFVALRPGRVTVLVEVGDTSLSRTITVVPPVSAVVWVPDAVVAHVGDTVQLRAVALDASGREVAVVYNRTYSRGGVIKPTGRAADQYSAFLADEPGSLTILARLGDRAAEVQVTVLP